MTNNVKTPYGIFTARLVDYERNFRPDTATYYTQFDTINKDLQSMENCKKLEFVTNNPIVINGKTYRNIKATIQWTKYRNGEELQEPVLYAWFTNQYDTMLTDAAKNKLEKELEHIFIRAYKEVLPFVIDEWKKAYLQGHKETLERMLDIANKHLTFIQGKQ